MQQRPRLPLSLSQKSIPKKSRFNNQLQSAKRLATSQSSPLPKHLIKLQEQSPLKFKAKEAVKRKNLKKKAALKEKETMTRIVSTLISMKQRVLLIWKKRRISILRPIKNGAQKILMQQRTKEMMMRRVKTMMRAMTHTVMKRETMTMMHELYLDIFFFLKNNYKNEWQETE